MVKGAGKQLQGRTILIPRPRGLGENLGQSVRAEGGKAILFPVLELEKTTNIKGLNKAIEGLPQVALIVLVSQSAATFLLGHLADSNLSIPSDTKVAAIGTKTALVCQRFNQAVDFCPEFKMNSEALMACLQSLELQDKKIVIFRGQDGRNYLRAALEAKGARVKYVECYTRVKTTQSFSAVRDGWKTHGMSAVVITSISILDVLTELMEKDYLFLLQNTPVVTISERIAAQCLRYGIKPVFVADQPNDGEVLKKMIECCGK